MKRLFLSPPNKGGTNFFSQESSIFFLFLNLVGKFLHCSLTISIHETIFYPAPDLIGV